MPGALGVKPIVAVCVAVSLAIDWLDYVTGEKYEFFIFYFAPIGVAAWHAGRGAGLFMAAVSAAAWSESDFLSHALYSPAVGLWDTLMRLTAFVILALVIAAIRDELREQRRLNAELAGAMAEIKQLKGILPMCTFCRKIRDGQNQWVPFERYIAQHTEAQVSHGMCPACYKKHYGDPDGT